MCLTVIESNENAHTKKLWLYLKNIFIHFHNNNLFTHFMYLLHQFESMMMMTIVIVMMMVVMRIVMMVVT